MEIFSASWNFNLVYRIEISSQLNSKLFVKMTLQLHVKTSARYTELKFQLGLANPRWNFNLGWRFQIFHIIDIFQPGMKIWYYLPTREFLVCFQKNKMLNLQAGVKWTDDKLISLLKCLQGFKVPRNLEIVTQTLTKSDYMKLWEKI